MLQKRCVGSSTRHLLSRRDANLARLNERPASRGKRASRPRARQPELDAPGASRAIGSCKQQSSSAASGGLAAGIGQSAQRRTLRQHGPFGLRAVAGAASRSPLAGHGMSPKRKSARNARDVECDRPRPAWSGTRSSSKGGFDEPPVGRYLPRQTARTSTRPSVSAGALAVPELDDASC